MQVPDISRRAAELWGVEVRLRRAAESKGLSLRGDDAAHIAPKVTAALFVYLEGVLHRLADYAKVSNIVTPFNDYMNTHTHPFMCTHTGTAVWMSSHF